METVTIIGLTAGACTATAAIPQLIKTIREKKVENISPFMFIILFGGNGLWVYYGILKSDVPIITTNSFSLLLDVIMLYLNFKFKK